MIPNLFHWSITLFCLAQIQPKIHMRIHVLLSRVGFTQNVPDSTAGAAIRNLLQRSLAPPYMTDVFYFELILQHLLFVDVVKCSSLCALRVLYHPNFLMIEARSYCFVAHQMTDELRLTIYLNCSPYSIF